MNLKPFRFWKGEILSLGLLLSLSWAGATPLWADTASFAYVTNGGANSVSGYDINAKTGALTPIPGSPFATGTLPYSVTVHPTGRFVYVANAGIPTNTFNVSAYAVNATIGALTPVPGSPFAAGVQPASVTINPNGQFAYVANEGLEVGDVSVYTINASTGALTPVPGSPFAAGHESVSVAVSPNGTFVYVVNSITELSNESGDVSAFVVNMATGALTPVSGSPFAAGQQAFGVAVHPSGRFAYVANALSNDVSAYSIDVTTGALTPVPGSPFAADFGSFSVALSPNGRFAYVANNAANDVSAYAINTTTGALTPVPGSPFAAGRFPTSVTTTAPAKRCKHDDEDRDRDERGDHNEQLESGGRDEDGRQDHLRFDRKHGCHQFGEKDFEEHDNDDAHERARDRF